MLIDIREDDFEFLHDVLQRVGNALREEGHELTAEGCHTVARLEFERAQRAFDTADRLRRSALKEKRWELQVLVHVEALEALMASESHARVAMAGPTREWDRWGAAAGLIADLREVMGA